MSKEEGSSIDKCPVDHATREAWLKSGRSRPVFPGVPAPEAPAPAPVPVSPSGPGCDSSKIDQTPVSAPAPSQASKGWFSSWFSSSAASPAPAAPKASAEGSLGLDREVSTIPRASPTDGPYPANSEKEGGVSESGNWIYPSEKMFFDAMKRKGYEGDARDMRTIVPIHNAVNERAWKEIKDWERPWGSEEKYV